MLEREIYMQDNASKRRFGSIRSYLSWRGKTYRDIGRGSRFGLNASAGGLNAFRLLNRAQQGSFTFQDKDGGYERFWRLVGTLGEDAIQQALYKWDRETLIFLMASAIFMALIPAFYFFFHLTPTGLFSLLFLAIAFIILGCRASYRAWQLKQRRMGSLRDFLFGQDLGATEIRGVGDD
ncbi:hypothetical protein Brsp01_51430 [Brucella sp. NBRC 12950]|nr:hypothetical protein Brsp01_51430 [Brucella sp. NBRC 12950]